MALKKDTIDIPFGGMDQKTNAKLVKPGSMLVVENGMFDDVGVIRKRFGFVKSANTLVAKPSGAGTREIEKVYGLGGGNLSLMLLGAQKPSTGERLRYDGSHLYRADVKSGKWASAGRVCQAETSVVDGSKGDYLSNVGIAVSQDFEAFCTYILGESKIEEIIVERSTGRVVYYSKKTGHHPHVFCPKAVSATSNTFYFMSADSFLSPANLSCDKVVPTTSPATVTSWTKSAILSYGFDLAEAVNVTSGGVDVFYATSFTSPDAHNVDARLFSTGADITSSEATTALVTPVNYSLGVFSGGAGIDIVILTVIFNDGTSRHVLGGHKATFTSGSPAAVVSNWGGVIVTLFHADSGSSIFNSTSMAGSVVVAESGNILCFMSWYDSGGTLPTTRLSVMDIALASGTVERVTHLACSGIISFGGSYSGDGMEAAACLIAGKAFQDKNGSDGRIYLPVYAANNTFPGMYLLSVSMDGNNGNEDIRVEAKLLGDNVLTTETTLVIDLYFIQPSVSDPNDANVHIVPAQRIDKLQSISASKTIRSAIGVHVDLDPLPVPVLEFAGLVVVGGGQVMCYDGSQVFTCGFPAGPAQPNLSDGGAHGSALIAGSYAYRHVYEYTDILGNVWRSEPSSQSVIADMTGGDQVDVLCSQAPLLPREMAEQTHVRIYRTNQGPGTVFYRHDSFDGKASKFYEGTGTPPDEGRLTLVYNDGTGEPCGEEVLYTAGGELAAMAPPASVIMAATPKRLFVVPSEDRKQVWFSKEKVAGLGIEFNSLFSVRIDDGGDTVALATLDDKVFVFKRNAMFMFYGEGPNKANVGCAFSTPVKVGEGIGCTGRRAAATIPTGILFLSDAGWHLIDRGLNTKYVGAGVDDYNAGTVRGIAVHPKYHIAVVILNADATALVYDYLQDKWSTWELPGMPADIALVDQTLYFADTSGNLWTWTPALYQDNAVSYNLRVVTPWIRLGSMAGFQRVSNVVIQGQTQQATALTQSIGLKIRHDDRDTDPHEESYTKVLGTVVDNSTDYMLFWDRQQARQKCSSVQYEIADSASNLDLRLITLSLRMGVKLGISSTLPASHVGGATAAPTAPVAPAAVTTTTGGK